MPSLRRKPPISSAAIPRRGTSLAASAHCLGYELSRCLDDPSSYILRIEWDSMECAQTFRLSTDHYWHGWWRDRNRLSVFAQRFVPASRPNDVNKSEKLGRVNLPTESHSILKI